ncbi:MAG: hydrophobe/amphiphile efflux-1 family RND transporter [Paracoccus denitrificans]|nr:MAG: hydrophobe/amphiphile efflux-1 family RND transporter [Paracoccus denitrificans]PZO83197.1 MAG: hydrophobe/amphiphile efflux-1 family RND transporter [Paracoccus denitrificans]
MARFFIHRPVFAWVLAIIVMLVGALGLMRLPIAQYPDIAPTTVRIAATYTGASPDIVENSVTTIIEDGMTGIDGLIYMTSTSSQGRASIELTFDDSVDPDIAQVQVQNKLQLVTAQLPSAVQAQGVSVSRSTSSILLVGALASSDGGYDSLELGDMIAQRIEDPVKRTPGVGSIETFSTGYAMRIWLDPARMLQYQVTPADVVAAVSEQNTNVTVGSLGSQPTVKGQQLNVQLSAQSQLTSAAEFERILLRTESDGATVFLGDVADIEIGQEDYGTSSRYNGNPAAGFAVNLATGANAVDTAAAVRDVLAGISSSLPAGLEILYPYDTSPFVEESINQVYHTLFEAVILVFLVILIFLQSWRATLIPTLAIPVVLLGTFGVLSFADMSINTLTMFAMVLAIGLLVDDAIVVVENVERVMEEEGLDPVAATEKSMDEISSALVGIVLVLSAVFLPMAFMTGSTGVIYRQFSVTIITAMVLSLAVALILTPALCATLLKPRKHGEVKFAPARWFNRNLDRMTNGYASTVGAFVKRPFRFLLVLALFGGGAYYLYQKLPGSFLPSEDQGVLMVMIETPEGSTAERTKALVEEVEKFVREDEKDVTDSVFAALGFSFQGASPRNAMAFIKLKPYDERKGQDAASLATRGNMKFFGNRNGQVFFILPPAIQGVGMSAGFSMQLVDQAGRGQAELAAAADRLVALGNADGRVTSLQGNDAPFETSRRIDIDQQKAAAYGLSIADLNQALSIIFASANVNDFSLGNDLRPVIVQGEASARMQPDDIEKWYVRNGSGDMVPFTAFTSQEWDQQAQSLSRYGGSRAMEISGAAAQGVSSGAAMNIMEELVSQIPGGYGTAWTGLSYQERLSGNQAPLLFAMSALVVFLALAALYESWSVPISVMMTVPIGIVGAMAAALWFGQSNDVYFKVGLLTTIGLAARNAILIVEFAEMLHKQGKPLLESAIEASKMRLRPILMTTLAFLLGVLPLALASGAGAAAQNSIGIGVIGGIATSALIGIFLVGVFYVVVLRIVAMVRRRSPDAPEAR